MITNVSGNWIVVVEPREWTVEEMAEFAGEDPSSLNPIQAEG